jgi:hypothetical protein
MGGLTVPLRSPPVTWPRLLPSSTTSPNTRCEMSFIKQFNKKIDNL